MEVTTAWITGTSCPSTRKWRSFLESWKWENVFLEIATNLIMSNEESAITLMNKGYISLRKGGDNVLASSSKCFSFQPDTLQSCLGSAWADCASSTHFPVGILARCKWWWLCCSAGGVQDDKEDNLSLCGHSKCEITYIKAEFPSRYFTNNLATATASPCTLTT